MVWNLKTHILIIDVSHLTNADKWLLILVCLLIFTKIDQILTTYNFIYTSALCLVASMTRTYDYVVNMDMSFMPFSNHV
jgi:hypothetical protein